MKRCVVAICNYNKKNYVVNYIQKQICHAIYATGFYLFTSRDALAWIHISLHTI